MVANKVGTLFNWTNYQPFKQYAVEAWWLDNLLKHEKMSRDVYLGYAKRIGIGFHRRLADMRAVERYEKALAMTEAVHSAIVGALVGDILAEMLGAIPWERSAPIADQKDQHALLPTGQQ